MSLAFARAVAALSFAATAATAVAVPVTVDFTSGAWSGANSSTPFTLGAITLSTGGAAQKLTQTSDGIGVDTIGLPTGLEDPNEVEGYERLLLTFSAPVLLQWVELRQLVQTNLPFVAPLRETVAYSINGGSWIDVQANATNGVRLLSLAVNDVTSFGLRGSVYGNASVASLQYVPLPGVLSLLGIGLVGIGLVARRRATA